MSPPNLIISALLAPAEFLLNELLNQDTLLADKLFRHAGTVIKVECTTPDITICLVLDEKHVRLVQEYSGDTDTTIRGSLPELISLLLQHNPSLHDSRVEVSGDMQKAQAIQKLLSASSIDWAFHFSRLFGDMPVQAASDFAEKADKTLREGAGNLQRNLDEYIHEEARLLPGREELEVFYADLDALKLRLDRLQARIQQYTPSS